MKISELQTEEELNQYKDLATYCFPDDFGWIPGVFNKDTFAGRVYGAKAKERIVSGLIHFHLHTTLWGKFYPVTGVGAVASYPEFRNSGFIRELMHYSIKEAVLEGKQMSFLYPFSYRYYEKFGYGRLGEYREATFSPEDIADNSAQGYFWEPFDESEESYAELTELDRQWHYSFPLGMMPDREFSLEAFKRIWKNHRVYLCRNLQGQVKSAVIFKLQMQHGGNSALQVSRMYWSEKGALHSLFHFFKSHRSQISRIQLSYPESFPLTWFMKEPRIDSQPQQCWMGRILQFEPVLRDWIDSRDIGVNWSFSVNDPVLEENRRSFVINQGALTIEEYRSENALDISDLSSILFGTVSPAELKLAGRIQEHQEIPESLFQNPRAVYINQSF